MLNKILLAFGIVVIVSALGNALTCQECHYLSMDPKAEQKCDPDNIVNCTTGYCYTSTLILWNGASAVVRDCDANKADAKICPSFCNEDIIKREGFKACAGACCQTDNCNNYDPTSSATGILVTKFTLMRMVIVGLVV